MRPRLRCLLAASALRLGPPSSATHRLATLPQPRPTHVHTRARRTRPHLPLRATICARMQGDPCARIRGAAGMREAYAQLNTITSEFAATDEHKAFMALQLARTDLTPSFWHPDLPPPLPPGANGTRNNMNGSSVSAETARRAGEPPWHDAASAEAPLSAAEARSAQLRWLERELGSPTDSGSGVLPARVVHLCTAPPAARQPSVGLHAVGGAAAAVDAATSGAASTVDLRTSAEAHSVAGESASGRQAAPVAPAAPPKPATAHSPAAPPAPAAPPVPAAPPTVTTPPTAATLPTLSGSVPAPPLALGTRVRVTGLKAKPHLNGQLGEVVGEPSATGRLPVVVDGAAEAISVLPKNLEALASRAPSIVEDNQVRHSAAAQRCGAAQRGRANGAHVVVRTGHTWSRLAAAVAGSVLPPAVPLRCSVRSLPCPTLAFAVCSPGPG